jgi:hypothetical protein
MQSQYAPPRDGSVKEVYYLLQVREHWEAEELHLGDACMSILERLLTACRGMCRAHSCSSHASSYVKNGSWECLQDGEFGIIMRSL